MTMISQRLKTIFVFRIPFFYLSFLFLLMSSCGAQTKVTIYNNTESSISVILAEKKIISAYGTETFNLPYADAIYFTVISGDSSHKYSLPVVPDNFLEKGLISDNVKLQINPDKKVYAVSPNIKGPHKFIKSLQQPNGFPLIPQSDSPRRMR